MVKSRSRSRSSRCPRSDVGRRLAGGGERLAMGEITPRGSRTGHDRLARYKDQDPEGASCTKTETPTSSSSNCGYVTTFFSALSVHLRVHTTANLAKMADQLAPAVSANAPADAALATFPATDAAGETVAAIAQAETISAGESDRCFL